MPSIIHPASGAYPLTQESVKAMFPPNTSFIEPFMGPDTPLEGFFWVEETAKPEFNPLTHQAVELTPVDIDGVWTQQWSVVALPESESLAAISLKKEELRDSATAHRWAVETGGITLPNGVQIATGTADQNRVTTVIANATLAGIDAVEFKASNGWVTLTLDQVRDIAAASALHVQACFSAERAHHEAIEALTDPAEIETYSVNANWPTSN